jgi:protein-S-isoprenylcysteine O-methyltransferase Ste14
MMILVQQPIELIYIDLNNEAVGLIYQSFRILILLVFVFSLPFNIRNDTLELKAYFNAIRTGIYTEPELWFIPEYSYKICRSPIRSCILFSAILSTSRYSLSLLIYIVVLYVVVTFDSISEESFLLKSKVYQNYVSQVRNRFIPNVFNMFRNIKKQDDHTKVN